MWWCKKSIIVHRMYRWPVGQPVYRPNNIGRIVRLFSIAQGWVHCRTALIWYTYINEMSERKMWLKWSHRNMFIFIRSSSVSFVQKRWINLHSRLINRIRRVGELIWLFRMKFINDELISDWTMYSHNYDGVVCF